MNMNLMGKSETELRLEQAIRGSNLNAAISLLRSGADFNYRNTEGHTLLMIAAGLGQSRMVELLITSGANVLDIEPGMGLTALHKASQAGNADVTDLLLNAGAFIDQQSPIFGNTALMDAIWHKHKAVVVTLLKRGARITSRNHYQESALDIAKSSGVDSITVLIQDQEELNNRLIETQRLHAAVKTGNIREVQQLIKSGANLNERAPLAGNYDDDYTPLGVAARDGHTEIVRALLAAGADVRRTNGLMKSTPAHEAAYEGRADVIKALVEGERPESFCKLELDAQGLYNGFSALHDAVWQGQLEAVRALLNADAPLSIISHHGLTPRGLATLYNYKEIEQLLADAEYRIQVKNLEITG